MFAAQSSVLEIGKRYVNGDGLMKDEVAGAAWLDRAARANHPEAQYLLGQLYLTGTGVQPSAPSAINLFNLSSQNGNLDACP